MLTALQVKNENNMNMNFTKVLVALFFISFSSIKAQQNNTNIHHNHSHADEFYLPLQFDKDSLSGFNEEAAWIQAKSNATEDWRQERIVAVLKRNFIDVKYGFAKLAPLPVVQGPCSNPGFETGTTAGWTTSESPNNNSQTMLPWSNLANTQANVVGVGTDPNIPALPTVPAGGGSFALRLGPTGYTSGGDSYRASQTFTVTAANSVFIYRYAVVLNNSSPHSCSDQPFFNIRFEDCNNNNIPCGAYNVTANGSACSSGDPNFIASSTTGNNWSYLPWQTRAFDLTNYIGQCVNVEFTVGGCVASQAGHGGYAYVDASCSPMTLNLNGTDIPVGQTNNSICGAATTNTLCAPPGFTYNWSGPGVNGQTGQCINASSNGTYSVTLGIAGSTCAFNPVLFSTFNSAPNPTVTASLVQPVCALPVGTASINVNGGTGPYTYSWSPAAPSASVNVNLPAGTAYSVAVIDNNGCTGSTTFSVDPYPPAPAYTLNVSPSYSISCASPSTSITFAPTGTTTTVSWGGPSGTITGTNVVVTAPGTYTYSAINTVSTCSLTGTINITGSINLPVLTSTLTQPNCADPVGSASVSVVNGTAPYSYSWLPAAVAAPTGTANTNLPPSSSYTVSVTDDAGCTAYSTFSINPFSGAPSYTLTNNPGLALSCATPSTTLTLAPTNANTSTSWTGPSGVISQTTTVATPTAAGTYSYVAINTISTCSVTGTFVITADTIKPTATYTVGCNTNTITVSASSSPSINLIWGVPTTPSTTISNPGSSTATGVYTLAAIDSNNGCIQTYTTLTSAPQISVVSSPASNLLTCLTTTINASATSTPSATITWDNGTSTVTSNQLPITASGSYTATATNSLGCVSQTVITVNTNTTVNVSANSTGIIPCTTGSLNITASSAGGGSYTYSWQPSSPTYTGTVFTATTPGTYTVVATNAVNGCTTSATSTLVYDNINASFDASVYSGLMPLPVTFTNTSIGTNPTGTTYSWNFGDGFTLASNDTTVNHLYNQGGLFPVILTAQNGFCVDTAVRYIKVDIISKFDIPNVFTPNGDGKNDVFSFNAINMGDIYVIIYDRWGLKMFEETATGNVKWDGKNTGGNTVTDGTYFYIVKATGLDGTIYDLKGTINVFK
jgi:gliding motility-associated-like protein